MTAAAGVPGLAALGTREVHDLAEMTALNRVDLPHRSLTMHLLYEDLARAHISERLEEAARLRRVNRIQAARRLARRAERVSQRARRALAIASMQP